MPRLMLTDELWSKLKAILRYHDPANWPIIREAITKMGLGKKLIGSKPTCLVPAETRGEEALRLNKAQARGKNNARGNKTSPGQKRDYTSNKPAKGKNGKQGLTRFSDNQFNDRKKPQKAK